MAWSDFPGHPSQSSMVISFWSVPFHLRRICSTCPSLRLFLFTKFSKRSAQKSLLSSVVLLSNSEASINRPIVWFFIMTQTKMQAKRILTTPVFVSQLVNIVMRYAVVPVEQLWLVANRVIAWLLQDVSSSYRVILLVRCYVAHPSKEWIYQVMHSLSVVWSLTFMRAFGRVVGMNRSTQQSKIFHHESEAQSEHLAWRGTCVEQYW